MYTLLFTRHSRPFFPSLKWLSFVPCYVVWARFCPHDETVTLREHLQSKKSGQTPFAQLPPSNFLLTLQKSPAHVTKHPSNPEDISGRKECGITLHERMLMQMTTPQHGLQKRRGETQGGGIIRNWRKLVHITVILLFAMPFGQLVQLH